MEEIGCKMQCDEALDILGRAGCDVGVLRRLLKLLQVQLRYLTETVSQPWP